MSEQYRDQDSKIEDYSRLQGFKKRYRYSTEFRSAEGYGRRDYHRQSQREDVDRENEQHWWDEIANELPKSPVDGPAEDITDETAQGRG